MAALHKLHKIKTQQIFSNTPLPNIVDDSVSVASEETPENNNSMAAEEDTISTNLLMTWLRR